MRTRLPRVAQVLEPLRAMLKGRISGAPRRTRKVATEWELPDHAWIDDRVRAWRAAQELVAHTITLYHPYPYSKGFLFPDASGAHWGSLIKSRGRTIIVVFGSKIVTSTAGVL